MARIPTYQKDIHISDLDRIIGTDGDTNELVTKNFFLGDIAEYVIDKFIDPDAVSFTIPVFRDTQDVLGSNATRITGSIMSQDVNPDGTKITIAGLLEVDKEAKIKGELTGGVAVPGQLVLNSSLNATGITIKAPAHADLPVSYTMELPNDIGTAGSQLTTDGVGKVYWADPEDDDLTVAGDFGQGTIDLDTQMLSVVGGDNISTTMLNQQLTINAFGFPTGSGTPYKLAIWDQTDNLTDSLISQGSTAADSLVEINSPQVVIGTGNATSYNQKLIGEGIDALNESLINGNTNVVLGEGSYGGVQGRKYFRDNTVILDRVLKLGSDDDTSTSVYNTIGTIHIGNPEWVRSIPYTNYPGIQGYFPTYVGSDTDYSSRFFVAHSRQVAQGPSAGDHPAGARLQLNFVPVSSANASDGSRAEHTFISGDGNTSQGNAFYFLASQNYDYDTGASSTPGPQGVFTFDARHANENFTAPAGTSLFLLKSGYGPRKFEIKQNAGGSSDPGAALIFGKGAASTAINSVAMGGNVTASGNQSFAAGSGSTASGENAISLGTFSQATGDFSFAAGDNAIAQHSSSTAIGKDAVTSAANQLALGGDSIRLNAYGAGTITGTEAYRLGVTSSGDIIEITDAGGNVTGTGTTQTLPVWSDGPNGVLGDSAIKQHDGNNITIGASVGTATGANYTLSVGSDNNVSTSTARALAVGANNAITGTPVDSAVIGNGNSANSSYSLTVGQSNQTNSGTSFVAGIDNVTSSNAPRQFVIGRANNVDSVDTIVLGDRNTVTETGVGFGSMMVFGHLNNVLGDRILCLGTSNTVNSDNQGAYIIGVNSSSTADRTYSVGQQNAITGNESYAFGKSNTIAAAASVAVGTNNNISAVEKAYAFGFGNDNINFKSFAIGDNNDVLNTQRTYLIGRENQPNTDNTIILGQFSDPTVLRSNNTQGRSTVAFAVGSNSGIRRTAWEFRGKQTSAGGTGAGDSMQVMAHALRYSTSYANDVEASTGGVEIGQLYRNGNDVKIRMSGDESSEATYLVPFNVTASPGGSSTLLAVDIATLVKISWSGVNGTYTLNLPPAADMQYRKVRFISDGTFGTGAGDKVLITPNGTETVDGASNFEISKSYEGVALWSDGTEWIIIQAKAH